MNVPLPAALVLALAMVGCRDPETVPAISVSSAPATSMAEPSADISTPTEAAYVKPPEDEIRRNLTDMQYHVTQQCGTEPPFRNAYWNNKRPGIYVDVVTGEPLFASVHKFDSGTGWPSFWEPLVADHVTEHEDRSHGMRRVEVKSRHGGSHLGHVFPDGPNPTGLRYCINSASLRFIPAEDLEKEGYGQFADLFADDAPEEDPPSR